MVTAREVYWNAIRKEGRGEMSVTDMDYIISNSAFIADSLNDSELNSSFEASQEAFWMLEENL